VKNLLTLFLLTLTVYSQNQVALEVSADQTGVIPIGIIMFSPMDNSEPCGDIQPWKVIAVDLDYTGDFSVKKFNALDSAKLMQEQIPVYIAGTYGLKGDTMTVDIYLYDSRRRDMLMGKSYQFHKKDMRLVAHKYSNEVHKMLLGEDGPYESKIAFVEKGGNDTKNIILCDYDGQNKNYITKGGINIMPSFIDKKNILCVAYDRGKPDIYSIDVSQGKKTAIVATRKVESSPNYSDITGRIIYGSSKSGNMEIYMVEKNGENEHRLTVSPPAINTAPNWSPNGYKIAFVSDRTGSPQIYVMDKTGTGVQRITFGGSYHDSPTWSPDGTKIAYTAQRNGRNIIAVNSVHGDDEELITVQMSGTQEYPSWSPDGSHIIFTLKQGGKSNISAIRLKDKRVIKLTEKGNAEQSKWSHF
jgi:TolB protein